VFIGRVIDRTAEAATFADAADLSASMFFVMRRRIVHANASGHAMLQGSLLPLSMAGSFPSMRAPSRLNEAMPWRNGRRGGRGQGIAVR
jgi:hypothetical protein